MSAPEVSQAALKMLDDLDDELGWLFDRERSDALPVIARFEAEIRHQSTAPLIAALEQARVALEAARNTFVRYAELHSAKGTPEADEKSLANLAEAGLINAALASIAAAQGKETT